MRYDLLNHAIINRAQADTGSGGLAEAGGAAFVRSLFRKNDSQDRAAKNWPEVDVDIASVDEISRDLIHYGRSFKIVRH